MVTGKDLFESILDSCPKKKVVSLCKKLAKKCSFNSGSDAQNLCHLAYRLFVYGYIDEALAISRYTHNVPFPGRGAFNVWTFILCLWGLEVFILKAQGKYDEADARVKEIDNIYIQPVGITINDSEDKLRRNADKRYQHFTYPDVLRRKNIEEGKSQHYANEWRFIALLEMIGYGATGLYPNLSAHWKELQQDINDYVAILSQEK